MIVTAIPILRFSLADIEAAYQTWGCNCGPAALAACLGMTLDEVRPHLGDFEKRGYMSPIMMEQAILRAGFRIASPSIGSTWPGHGLAKIQFGGPWTRPGANPKWAAIHTHWVASKRPKTGIEEAWVFDVNGGWMTFDAWVNDLVPLLVKSCKRADGTWLPTYVREVRRYQS